jgi:RNA polymerase sigma factor (sigma-70 family)
MTDEELIRLCYSKKREGQQILFEKFKRRIMGICLRYAYTNQEADDILQESFIKIFKSLEKLNSKEIQSLEGWIVKITVNTAINFAVNQKQKYPEKVGIESVSKSHDEGETPLEQMAAEDLLRLIRQMPKGYLLVFNLYAIEGYDHREIADRLHITESASRSQLTRSKMWLKEKLKNQDCQYEKANR